MNPMPRMVRMEIMRLADKLSHLKQRGMIFEISMTYIMRQLLARVL